MKTDLRLKRVYEQVEMAFPGVLAVAPHHYRVSEKASIRVRGTKVLLRKPRESDIIPSPVGDGGVIG